MDEDEVTMIGGAPWSLRFVKALVRPTWVEVDLDALEYNVRSVKRMLGGVRLIGVLKGDACGFGTEECGVAMERAGVDMVAVGNPFEAEVLRRAGVKCPILLFASYTGAQAEEIVGLGAIPTVVDSASALALAAAAEKLSKAPLEVFVKVDTGLGRLGVPYVHAVGLIKRLAADSRLYLKGVYSHAGSSKDEWAVEMFRRLQQLFTELEARGIDVPYRFIASTPYVLRHPEMWLNTVDPGRLLFGIKQPAGAPAPEGLVKPVLRGLRTRLIQVKDASTWDPPAYRARADVTRYGVVPFGWADVFLPALYEKSGAVIRGTHVGFLGKLTTEHGVLDLTPVADCGEGDVVTLLGEDSGTAIDPFQLAHDNGALMSDITRRFHRHLPYVYFRDGKPAKVKTLGGHVL